jgi:hypothetical protein
LYALVLAPAVWVLAGVGLTHDLSTRGRDEFAVESITGLVLLLLAGAAYAILLFAPISPAGPTLGGLAFLGAAIWALQAPTAYADVWPAGVAKEGFDLSRPGYGLAALLAVPLIGTALSARRWARYEPPVLPIVGQIGRATGSVRPVAGTYLASAQTALLPGRQTDPDPTTVFRLPSLDATTTVVASSGADTTVIRTETANDATVSFTNDPTIVVDNAETVVSASDEATEVVADNAETAVISDREKAGESAGGGAEEAGARERESKRDPEAGSAAASSSEDDEPTVVTSQTPQGDADTTGPVDSDEAAAAQPLNSDRGDTARSTEAADADTTSSLDAADPDTPRSTDADDADTTRSLDAADPDMTRSLDATDAETARPIDSEKAETAQPRDSDGAETTGSLDSDAAEATRSMGAADPDATSSMNADDPDATRALDADDPDATRSLDADDPDATRSLDVPEADTTRAIPIPRPVPAAAERLDDADEPTRTLRVVDSDRTRDLGDDSDDMERTQVIRLPVGDQGERTQVVRLPQATGPTVYRSGEQTRVIPFPGTGDVGGDETQIIRFPMQRDDAESTQVIRSGTVKPPPERTEVIRLPLNRASAPADNGEEPTGESESSGRTGKAEGPQAAGAEEPARSRSIAEEEAPDIADDPTSRIEPVTPRTDDDTKRPMTVMKMERPPAD